MGTWKHRLTDIDPKAKTAMCANCGIVRIARSGRTVTGKPIWRCTISQNHRPTDGPDRRKPYRYSVLSYCARCGFEPEDMVQMDVNHIDGDHTNNALENLQTLCANCHRIVTKEQRHGIYAKHLWSY